MRYAMIGLILCMGLYGCATTNLPPVTSSEFAFQDDERRIWLRSEEEEKVLNNSGMVYADKKLNAYLDGIGKKLQPPKAYEKVPFEIVVLKNPYSNAFAFPNGVVYIHTGILARMDNEAQLATLLAHEMTHATYRHQVREYRGLRNKSAVFASVRATLGGLPAIGGLATALGEIGTMASVTGYSRDLETEADMEGIRLVVKAGYDPREAPKLFQHIKDELKEEEIKEPFFFGSHPKLQDRADNYREFLKNYDHGHNGIVNADVFLSKTAGAILENAFLDLQAGRFDRARQGAEKYLSVKPGSAKGYYLLGEICRQRGEEGDLKEAKEHYLKAVKLNSSYAVAYKGVGLLYFKQGEKSRAKKAFKSYLSRAPQAGDRSYVQEYITQCK